MALTKKQLAELRYQEVKAVSRLEGHLSDMEIANLLRTHHNDIAYISTRRVNQIRAMSDNGRPVNLQYGHDILTTRGARVHEAARLAGTKVVVNEVEAAFEARAVRLEELMKFQLDAMITQEYRLTLGQAPTEKEREALITLAYRAIQYRCSEIVPELVKTYARLSKGAS